MNYERLKQLVACGRKGTGQKLIQRNTWAVERDPKGNELGRWNQTAKLGDKGNAIAVKLHRTDILTYFADGRVTINLGGWNTVTTRDRVNSWGPGARVSNDRGELCLYFGGWSDSARRFAFDGCVTLTRKGTLSKKDQRKAKRLERERRERRLAHARAMAAHRREEKKAERLAKGVEAFVWYFGGWKLSAASGCVDALRAGYYAAVQPYEAVEAMLRELRETFEVARPVDVMPPPDAFEAWHFVYLNHATGEAYTMNGSLPVKVGQTLYVPAGAKQCQYGLHSSPSPSMARGYCSGPMLCRVLCWGETEHGGNKSASQYRHVVDMHDISDLSRRGLRGELFDQACFTRFGVQG